MACGLQKYTPCCKGLRLRIWVHTIYYQPGQLQEFRPLEGRDNLQLSPGRRPPRGRGSGMGSVGSCPPHLVVIAWPSGSYCWKSARSSPGWFRYRTTFLWKSFTTSRWSEGICVTCIRAAGMPRPDKLPWFCAKPIYVFRVDGPRRLALSRLARQKCSSLMTTLRSVGPVISSLGGFRCILMHGTRSIRV